MEKRGIGIDKFEVELELTKCLINSITVEKGYQYMVLISLVSLNLNKVGDSERVRWGDIPQNVNN